MPRAFFRAAALGLCVALAGCSDNASVYSNPEADSAPQPEAQAPALPPPLQKVGLGGGDVVVMGFDGYCIDPQTLENRATRGFALLASCRILTGGKSGAFVSPVLASVTVGARGSGKALPSAEGLAGGLGVPLLASGAEAGVTVLHLGAGGDEVLDDGDPRHWRAVFSQNGRLVSLALYAPKGDALAGAAGQGFVSRFAARIISESGGADPAPAPTAAEAGDGAAATADRRPRDGGLLNRLFRG